MVLDVWFAVLRMTFSTKGTILEDGLKSEKFRYVKRLELGAKEHAKRIKPLMIQLLRCCYRLEVLVLLGGRDIEERLIKVSRELDPRSERPLIMPSVRKLVYDAKYYPELVTALEAALPNLEAIEAVSPGYPGCYEMSPWFVRGVS